MKRAKRRWIPLVVLAVLAAGWIWRYVTFNAFYGSLHESVRYLYQMGEIMPLEDPRTENSKQVGGYSIRVDSFEIMDYQEFLDFASTTAGELGMAPEKVAVARVTIFNDNSLLDGISFYDLWLHGVDNYATPNLSFIQAVNPILTQDSAGISLKPGGEYELILPFPLLKSFFGMDTWNHIEDYHFYLCQIDQIAERDIACWTQQ